VFSDPERLSTIRTKRSPSVWRVRAASRPGPTSLRAGRRKSNRSRPCRAAARTGHDLGFPTRRRDRPAGPRLRQRHDQALLVPTHLWSQRDADGHQRGEGRDPHPAGAIFVGGLQRHLGRAWRHADHRSAERGPGFRRSHGVNDGHSLLIWRSKRRLNGGPRVISAVAERLLAGRSGYRRNRG
jgi:hypothetical protein